MIKHYCDRCGTETTEYFDVYVMTAFPKKCNSAVDSMDYSIKELCPLCLRDYKVLMNGFINDNVKVYKNPMTNNYECEGRYL